MNEQKYRQISGVHNPFVQSQGEPQKKMPLDHFHGLLKQLNVFTNLIRASKTAQALRVKRSTLLLTFAKFLGHWVFQVSTDSSCYMAMQNLGLSSPRTLPAIQSASTVCQHRMSQPKYMPTLK